MTPTTPSPISDQAAGERFAITVWKDGSWKQWQSGDAVYAESDPDWLTTIRPTAPPAASAPTGCVVIEEADMVPHVHPEYGVGLFVTDDCVNKMNGCASASSTAPTTGSAPTDAEIWNAWLEIIPSGAGTFDPDLIKLVRRFLAAPASPAASVPHPSIARAIAQEERACRAEDALIDLVNQIRKSNPVDDHGHDLKMNMAYLEAVKLLDAVALLAASMGGDKA